MLVIVDHITFGGYTQENMVVTTSNLNDVSIYITCRDCIFSTASIKNGPQAQWSGMVWPNYSSRGSKSYCYLYPTWAIIKQMHPNVIYLGFDCRCA